MNSEKSYMPREDTRNISLLNNPPAYFPNNEIHASQVPVAPAQVMYAQAPPAMVANPVGPKSTTVTCPSCKAQISSRVEFQPSTKTHLIALLSCVIGFWLCCCIPYCNDSCQNANHYCPSCQAYLGTYKN